MPPPPPPPPPGPPPPPAMGPPKISGSAGAPSRNALLSDIHKGKALKKVQTNDRSAPIVDPKAPISSSSSVAKGPLKPSSMQNNSDGSGAGPPQLGGLFAGGMPKLKPVGGGKPTSNGPSPRDASPSTAFESEPPPPPKSKPPPPGRGSPPVNSLIGNKNASVNHNNNNLNGNVRNNGEFSRNGTVERKISDNRPPPPPQKSVKVLQDVEARRKSSTNQGPNDISPDSPEEEFSPPPPPPSSNGLAHNRFPSAEMRSGVKGPSRNGMERKPKSMEPPPPPDASRKPSVKNPPPPLPSTKPVGTPQSKTIGHAKTSRPGLPYHSDISSDTGGAFNMRTRASSDENLVPPPPPRDNRPTINKSQTQTSLTNGSRPSGAQTPPSARRGGKPNGPPPPPPPISKPQGPPPPPPIPNFGTIGPKRPLPPTPSVAAEFPTPVPVSKSAYNGGPSQLITPPNWENPPPPPKRGSSQSAFRESPAGSELEKLFDFEDIWNLPPPEAFRNLPKRFVRAGAERSSGRKAAPLPPMY